MLIAFGFWFLVFGFWFLVFLLASFLFCCLDTEEKSNGMKRPFGLGNKGSER